MARDVGPVLQDMLDMIWTVVVRDLPALRAAIETRVSKIE